MAAETLTSPRAMPSSSRGLQSPPPSALPASPFFLGSNDDHLEKTQARAARAAAIRRKSIASLRPLHPNFSDPASEVSSCLQKNQILELYRNCIKLASENKINQKNTWELGLIDHLYEIIKVEEEADAETNFQKASCTLEAGVKIYSLRVDSVHSEAYKVLGGMNRVGQANEQDAVDSTDDRNAQEGSNRKKDQEKKLSPLSTLEANFEALNVKKFDAAFAVDPLYHQTSAQFDEGGAKGLLLNNLGVYGGCRVLFDSLELPGKCMLNAVQHDSSDTIDLCFAREYIEKMVSQMQLKDEISPTLSVIINHFDEDNLRPPDTYSSGEVPEEVDVSYNDAADGAYNWDTGLVEHDDQTSMAGDVLNDGDSTFANSNEAFEGVSFAYDNGAMDDDTDDNERVDKIDEYLFLSMGISSKHNAWAGPDHWKYQKSKGMESKPSAEAGKPLPVKKPRKKKQAEVDLSFTDAPGIDMAEIFAPAKNPKSLLLPANRSPSNTKLPEDCHYKPENLVKLFLLPNVMCLKRRKGRKPSDDSGQHFDDFGPSSSWGGENALDGEFDDGNAQSDGEDIDVLVTQPRQVNKIEVQYDKTSKQVDVHALKGTLWDQIQISTQSIDMEKEEAVSFRDVLAKFPDNCQAAAAPEDISPHLCFICLLHLANEHGLRILGCTNMDDLSIHVPRK